MGRDDRSNASLYIAIGALAAVGAGYLLWRFAVPDDAKQKTKDALLAGLDRARTKWQESATAARDFMPTAVTR